MAFLVLVGFVVMPSVASPQSSVVVHVHTHAPVVALTFDDGPSSTYTPIVLDILQRYGAHATFFVIGKEAEQHPQLLREIVASHNEIGNHTYSHRVLTHASPEKVAYELGQCDRVVFEATRVHPTLFRPVEGFYDAPLTQRCAQMGYRLVLWNHDSVDWSRPSVAAIVSRTTKNVRPGDVLLFHDGGGDRSRTVAALPHVISVLEAEGFSCVTVGELLRNQQDRPAWWPYFRP